MIPQTAKLEVGAGQWELGAIGPRQGGVGVRGGIGQVVTPLKWTYCCGVPRSALCPSTAGFLDGISLLLRLELVELAYPDR